MGRSTILSKISTFILTGGRRTTASGTRDVLTEMANTYVAAIYDTAANFTSSNPVLETKQIGVETDDLVTVPRFKIGDGVNDWNTLPYFGELGYTPEDVSNKSTDVNTDQASNMKYPSVKAVFDWAIGLFVKKGTLTTNYIPKATASDTIGDSQIYDDGTSVGISATSPTSKLHIQGIDATSTNYALKVDNSASSPLLYVRNDGNVGIGEANPIVKLQVNGSLYNNGGRFGDVVIGTYPYVSGLSNEIQGNPLIFNYTGGFDAGVGTNSPTAKFHIKGSGLTSATYALKVDNILGNTFSVRNDGIVNIGGLTPSQIVGTDASKNLVSIPFGTTAGTVLEGDKGVTVIYRDFTDTSPYTGTLAITQINSALIEAGKIAVNDEVEIEARSERSGTAVTGNNYLYVNTNNSLSGATLIGTYGAAGHRSNSINRTLWIDGSNSKGFIGNYVFGNAKGVSTPQAFSLYNIDWTNDVYIIQAYALGDISYSAYSRGMLIKRTRM